MRFSLRIAMVGIVSVAVTAALAWRPPPRDQWDELAELAPLNFATATTERRARAEVIVLSRLQLPAKSRLLHVLRFNGKRLVIIAGEGEPGVAVSPSRQSLTLWILREYRRGFAEHSLRTSRNTELVEATVPTGHRYEDPVLQLRFAGDTDQVHAYGIVGHDLLFLRRTIDGRPCRNEYIEGMQAGPRVASRTEEQWEEMLASGRRVATLHALSWLGGIHRKPNVTAESELAFRVRERPAVRRLINRWTTSSDPWLQEAAERAANPEYWPH